MKRTLALCLLLLFGAAGCRESGAILPTGKSFPAPTETPENPKMPRVQPGK